MKHPKKYLVFLFFLLSFFNSCNLKNPYPTDDALIRRFDSNKESFDKLVQMFQEDFNLLRINLKDNAWKSYEIRANLKEERLSEYKSLLTKLNIEQLERYENRKDIYFRVLANPNIFIGGKSKY